MRSGTVGNIETFGKISSEMKRRAKMFMVGEYVDLNLMFFSKSPVEKEKCYVIIYIYLAVYLVKTVCFLMLF